MSRLRWWLVAAVMAGGSACLEDIDTPGECPALCPGEQLIVRDTTIFPVPASDSSFFGYLPRAARSVLLVSSQLPAGEYRSFVVFPKQTLDSIQIDGSPKEFLIDTVAISFTLQSRDSTATGLTVYLHRIPITTDTTVDFAGLESLIGAGELLDSIPVPDSVRAGTITALFTGDELAKLARAPEDSGRIGIGLTMRASKPTGIRLGVDAVGSAAAPLYQNRGRVDVPDTARRRQVTSVRPDDAGSYGYVGNVDLSTAPDPDLLYVGGPGAARTIIRFVVPDALRDSAQIIRATLELTPAQPLLGLPNKPGGDSLDVFGVIADLGAKSPPLLTGGLVAGGGLAESTTNVVSVDMFLLAGQWLIENGPPPVVVITHADETLGGGFMQPVFYSTRSPTGTPRLRITYGLPTKPGRP